MLHIVDSIYKMVVRLFLLQNNLLCDTEGLHVHAHLV